MAPQLRLLRPSLEKRELNSCQIFYAVRVVWLWATSSGWRTWSTWDGADCWESGRRSLRKTCWTSCKRRRAEMKNVIIQPKSSYWRAPPKETSSMRAWKKLFHRPPRIWSGFQKSTTQTCGQQPTSWVSPGSMTTTWVRASSDDLLPLNIHSLPLNIHSSINCIHFVAVIS